MNKEILYLGKAEYRELVLARMAAGDLYASEEFEKVKKVDRWLDKLRITPIYPAEKKEEK